MPGDRVIYGPFNNYDEARKDQLPQGTFLARKAHFPYRNGFRSDQVLQRNAATVERPDVAMDFLWADILQGRNPPV